MVHVQEQELRFNSEWNCLIFLSKKSPWTKSLVSSWSFGYLSSNVLLCKYLKMTFWLFCY